MGNQVGRMIYERINNDNVVILQCSVLNGEIDGELRVFTPGNKKAYCSWYENDKPVSDKFTVLQSGYFKLPNKITISFGKDNIVESNSWNICDDLVTTHFKMKAIGRITSDTEIKAGGCVTILHSQHHYSIRYIIDISNGIVELVPVEIYSDSCEIINGKLHGTVKYYHENEYDGYITYNYGICVNIDRKLRDVNGKILGRERLIPFSKSIQEVVSNPR